MFSKNFTKLQNPSPWRRLSLATWKAPNDSSVYGTMTVEATPLLAFLEKINKTSPVKITITHVVAKAVALTLKKYPDINGIVRFGNIYLRQSVDIFLQVAVAETLKDRPDLSGAKINNCDQKSLLDIAQELIGQSQKIRQKEDPNFKSSHNLFKKVPSLVLSWGLRLASFLIYDLGLSIPKLGLPSDPFGSAMITSVGSLGVPPGFAPIVPMSRVPLLLCVGETTDRPWVVEKKVEARPVFDINVTFDHRFMDGLTGSRMYKYMTQILAAPENFLN